MSAGAVLRGILWAVPVVVGSSEGMEEYGVCLAVWGEGNRGKAGVLERTKAGDSLFKGATTRGVGCNRY